MSSLFGSDPALVVAIAAAAFFAGGLVKGVVGIGLPLVAVPLLATVFDVVTAITAMAVPILISNVWQALHGRRYGMALRRFWPLLVTLIGFTVLGAQFLTRLDPEVAELVVGFLVLVFCASQLLPRPPRIAARFERPAAVPFGAAAGLLGGMSSIFGPPLYVYLFGLRLTKDDFVTTVALCFLAGTVPLYLSLAGFGVFGASELMLSTAGLLPMFAGLQAGRRLRGHLDQRSFERLLLVVLAIIAANLLRQGWLG